MALFLFFHTHPCTTNGLRLHPPISPRDYYQRTISKQHITIHRGEDEEAVYQGYGMAAHRGQQGQ
jgi:hypothetical protein